MATLRQFSHPPGTVIAFHAEPYLFCIPGLTEFAAAQRKITVGSPYLAHTRRSLRAEEQHPGRLQTRPSHATVCTMGGSPYRTVPRWWVRTVRYLCAPPGEAGDAGDAASSGAMRALLFRVRPLRRRQQIDSCVPGDGVRLAAVMFCRLLSLLTVLCAHTVRRQIPVQCDMLVLPRSQAVLTALFS